jgi:hypothetical protein
VNSNKWESQGEPSQDALSQAYALIEEMRGALLNLEVSANTVAYCYSLRPGSFADSLAGLRYDAERAREVTAKADAVLAEREKMQP